MKTTLISRILLTLGLVFVLGSAITPVHGGGQPTAASLRDPPNQQLPVVSIHSTDNVSRGKIGTFVLASNSSSGLATTFVKFSVSGTAIPGVDYVPLVSPAFIGQSGFGVILVKTLSDFRAAIVPQARSVVVTVEPGLGYAVGAPSSAEILIKP